MTLKVNTPLKEKNVRFSLKRNKFEKYWVDLCNGSVNILENYSALGNLEYPFIAITPRSTMSWHGTTC